jgi:hypothetical protein
MKVLYLLQIQNHQKKFLQIVVDVTDADEGSQNVNVNPGSNYRQEQLQSYSAIK